MSEPTHAVVIDATVTSLLLMDATVADLFRELGFVELLWPGGALIDATALDPPPQLGWSYDGNTFAPPVPTPT